MRRCDGSAAKSVQVPAFEHSFAPLVDQPHLDLELSPLPAGLVIDLFDLELGLYGIVLEHRLVKGSPLSQQRDHRMLELLGKRRGAHRRQRHKMEAMDDRPAKTRSPGVFIVVVDRVLVAREGREGKDVCLGDFSRVPWKYLTLAEIFKKELRGLSRHSILPFFPAPMGEV